jgi:hypothetical protein
VNEPNGLLVPKDTSSKGELQLYHLFQQRGETSLAASWLSAGLPTPATFSPLCDFTATFVLKQSASSLGVGWYNVLPGATIAPQAADIHVIFPAGSGVGATVTSANIKSDPSYLGGEIGFALLGSQIHYSEQKWNFVCTACNPQAPWITSLTYKSDLVPDAYYVGFEDGPLEGGKFNNDGDFNDYVFFFTGLTCSGGGAPCDTGQPGVCGAGLTECVTGGGVDCKQLTQGGAEKCNGLDDDCNGAADEGDALCPSDEVCDHGQCVKKCGGGEFVCPTGKVCANGFCVEQDCTGVTCPEGQVCLGGTCRAPCDGVVCPPPSVCRADACVDPCAGVACDAGKVCREGVCVPHCACSPCGSSLACQAATGLCVDAACAGVTCGGGTTCIAGACVDACSVAVCPPGQACLAGGCTPVTPDAGTEDDAGGGLVIDAGQGDAATAADASEDGPAEPGTGSRRAADAGADGGATGCGCRQAGHGAPARAGVVAAAGLAALLARRRRRR